MMRLLMGVLLGLTLLPTVSVASSSQNILASIKPLELIVRTLNKPLLEQNVGFEVSTLLPPGATPHDYVLKPSDIVRVLNADLVIWMGAAVEPYLVSVIAKADQDKVVDISQLGGLKRLPFRALLENGNGHDNEMHHDHHDDHEMLQFDPHLWWSVDNAEIIMMQVLAILDVTGNDKKVLVKQVMSPIRAMLSSKKALAMKLKPSFILFHDGLQYLECDLAVESAARVALDDDHRPGIKTLLALKQKVKVNQVACVVAETNTNVSVIHKIEAATPLRQVVIDSLGWGRESYQDMLEQAYDNILACQS